MINGKKPLEAFKNTITKLEGAYAIVAIFRGYDDLMIGTKLGSPLLYMKAKNMIILSSDAYSISDYGSSVTYLEDGDIIVTEKSKISLHDNSLKTIQRPLKRSKKRDKDGLNGYDHFMIKRNKRAA